MKTDQEVSIMQQIAAGIYYHENGTGKSFESLTAEELKPWFERAISALVAIEKINMVVVAQAKVNLGLEAEAKHLERLTQIIQKFVKGLTTTKPALFPVEELAHRILDGLI